MKSKKLKQLLLLETLFMVFLAGIHYLLLQSVLPENYLQFRIVYVYILLWSLSIFGTFAIFAIHKNDETMLGKGFIVFTVIKLLVSIVFLLPSILNQDDLTRPFVYQFFAVFFPSLLIETLVILRMINFVEVKKSENNENP